VDATALYYTFSTIAQTLAGALAVLVAFSLFGLAKLDEAIERGRGSVGGYKDWQKHWKALLADDVEGFEKSVGVRVDDASSRTRMHGAYVAADQRPRILDALRRALAATVADIALCFIALPVTPSLASRTILAWSTAGMAVAVGIVCLLLYWQLIAAMVIRPRQ
jgi:hypothetical protein